MVRKGYGRGRGQGYKNLQIRDPLIHGLSAKGVHTNRCFDSNKTYKTVRYNKVSPIDDGTLIYEGKMYGSKDDLKYMPDKVRLVKLNAQRKIITYAVDDDGEVWSRVGSEVAVPVIDYEGMKPKNKFEIKRNLEKFNVFQALSGSDNLIWTKKIPKEIKNEHRKFWDMKELDARKGIGVGTKVEMEHTLNKKVARKIAQQHLNENKNYYKYFDTKGKGTKEYLVSLPK